MASTKTKVETTCPDSLSREHLEQFAEIGYLAFDSVLTTDEVTELRLGMSEITHRIMESARSGRAEIERSTKSAPDLESVTIKHPDSGYSIQFEPGVDPLALDNEESEIKYRKLYNFHHVHPAFEKLATEHPRIFGFIESILGEASVLKDSMALSKPPYIGTEKPWHQDNAYFDWLPLEKIATVWIALDDATIENGCMHVLPGEHTRGALKHHHTFDCEILPDRIDASNAVPVELKAGGAMYFSAMLPHQTPPNTSRFRRRALQFQYRATSTRRVSKEEFGRVFAEADGTPASCAF